MISDQETEGEITLNSELLVAHVKYPTADANRRKSTVSAWHLVNVA